MLFTIGALFFGASTYSALGALGLLVPDVVSTLLVVVVMLASLFWHAFGYRSFPGDREARQANRSLALRGVSGVFYFGGLLSIGLLTEMTTPLVYGGACISLWAGPQFGAMYGSAFGLGRAVPAMIGVCRGDRSCPAVAAAYPALAFRRTARLMGTLVPSGVLFALVDVSLR